MNLGLNFCFINLFLFALLPPTLAESCHTTEMWSSMHTQEITLRISSKLSKMNVKFANTAAKRASGYQWICEADASQTAILFVFPELLSAAFHMRNVFVPLDIYFFDEQGKQVDAMVMRPETQGSKLKPRNYRPSAGFQYALEIARSTKRDFPAELSSLELVIDSF